LAWLSGLNPAPLSGTLWPTLAWLGADTTGVATILGGVWRVVGVVWALCAAVVLVVPEVVEVGNVVVEVPVVFVVEVLEASAAVGAVETLEVVG
jgi:hypothetical protein